MELDMQTSTASESIEEQEKRAAAAVAQLPPLLASRVSFQTGGMKRAYQEEETLILWNTFKQCFPTEADAEIAVAKNSMTVNPSMNSPTKISGTYALLVERFGQPKATEIITQNPGILTCRAEMGDHLGTRTHGSPHLLALLAAASAHQPAH